jgi:quinohemoprotein amine dehydrogenase
VDVKWSLEEYPATFTDDDIQYVGTLDENGLFTPNLDGPNPKRSGNRNNVGDVWVVAEYAGTRPIRGRAHLLVTVPLYMNWFAESGK